MPKKSHAALWLQAKKELLKVTEDLTVLVQQKSELQLENSGLTESIDQLRSEKQQILDAKEELHDRYETAQ